MKKYFILLILLVLTTLKLTAQNFIITGSIKTPVGENLRGASVVLNNTRYGSTSDSLGNYSISNIRPGKYVLKVTLVGYRGDTYPLTIKSNLTLNLQLDTSARSLQQVNIHAQKENSFGITRLKAVEGTNINAGKKSEVIVLNDVTANTATNNARQIYSKIAGLNIWESDGAGIQLGIGGRGLNPNRVTNFNTRQNGYDMSADALGYPESYYSPPAELVDRIEILRGAASLQYGTQFGGLINFKLKDAPADKSFEIIARETAGSWGFLNTTASVGGTDKKLQYYAFIQHKSGDGWRPNSSFNVNTGYGSLTYNASDKFSITFQYTHMDYLAHQPGGLTDAEFDADPRQSVRDRNWFKVNWNLGAILLNYQINDHLKFNSRFFALSASRDAVGDLNFINIPDPDTGRTLYKDKYTNYGNESRLLYTYKIKNRSQDLLVGMRYYHGFTNRQQGIGNAASTGNASDFTYSPTDNFAYSNYKFPNYNLALFAENIFRITSKFSVIPGVRFENIITKADGDFSKFTTDQTGKVIFVTPVHDLENRTRHFAIAGLGLSYFQNQAVQLYGNISQNYRAINFNDINSSNPSLLVDPNLQDETGYSADMGMRGNITNVFNYDVSLFTIYYDNKIGNENINATDYRTNISASRSVGLESFAELELLHFFDAQQSDKLSVFSNFAYINARYTGSKETAFLNRKVELAPDVIFKTGLSYKHKRLSASYQLAYTSSQFTDATNAISTADAINGLVPAYTVMDLSANYELTKIISLSGSINNMANARYFTRRADSYPGPGIIPADGRGYFITLQVKL